MQIPTSDGDMLDVGPDGTLSDPNLPEAPAVQKTDDILDDLLWEGPKPENPVQTDELGRRHPVDPRVQEQGDEGRPRLQRRAMSDEERSLVENGTPIVALQMNENGTASGFLAVKDARVASGRVKTRRS